jgi:hypothetical protein
MQSNVNGSDAALEGPAPPEVEVRSRPMRRRFTSEYKLASGATGLRPEL